MQIPLAITGVMALCFATGCSEESSVTEPPAVAVDSLAFLVPPLTFPVSDQAIVTQAGNGFSRLIRSPDEPKATARLSNQTPGNVLVYTTITFNHPEYCREGEDRMPRPGPCRGNGPTDPRDGLIPEVQISADVWASVVVGEDGVADFAIDFASAVPLQSINGGPGIVNPEGAVVFSYVLDKGPVVAEGPLRGVQLNTAYGGCQGPPAFGTLPCRGVAVAQHLPASS